MKTIGIDINEVLRSHWLAFEQQYVNYMKREGEEPEIVRPFNSYEYLNHFKFPEKLVKVKYLKDKISEDISAKDYILDENGISAADPLLFDVKEELLSPKERLDQFLYEEYFFELFGSCGRVYQNVGNDLRNFYNKNKEDFNIIITSLEERRSVPTTLFFLSKLRVDFASYYFSNKPEAIWEKVDILITANPSLLNTKPKPSWFYYNKEIIKVVREFNTNDGEPILEINILGDLLDKNLRLI